MAHLGSRLTEDVREGLTMRRGTGRARSPGRRFLERRATSWSLVGSSEVHAVKVNDLTWRRERNGRRVADWSRVYKEKLNGREAKRGGIGEKRKRRTEQNKREMAAKPSSAISL